MAFVGTPTSFKNGIFSSFLSSSCFVAERNAAIIRVVYSGELLYRWWQTIMNCRWRLENGTSCRWRAIMNCKWRLENGTCWTGQTLLGNFLFWDTSWHVWINMLSFWLLKPSLTQYITYTWYFIWKVQN